MARITKRAYNTSIKSLLRDFHEGIGKVAELDPSLHLEMEAAYSKLIDVVRDMGNALHLNNAPVERRMQLRAAAADAIRFHPEAAGEYGRLAKLVNVLLSHKATPREIQERAAMFRKSWPKMNLTPESFAKNWITLGNMIEDEEDELIGQSPSEESLKMLGGEK